MKTLKFFGMLLMGAMMALSFTACGSDDDDDDNRGGGGGGGSAQGATSITVNGTTFSGSYAFYHIDKESNETFYEIWLTNCNLPNVQDPWMTIGIMYMVEGGSTTQVASGEFDNFQISLSLITSDNSKDKTFIGYGREASNQGKLKVSVNGNNITIDAPAMKYYDGLTTSAKSYDGAGFAFNGTIAKMPEGFKMENGWGSGPTAKEKAMVPSMMRWQLVSTLVINYPGSPNESRRILYAGQDTYQWVYTFYPYTYRFPDNIVFESDMIPGESYQLSTHFSEDYCKYLCTIGDNIISAGYLTYYNDKFTFSGLQQGGWVEFMMRETEAKWDTDVWTCAYNYAQANDGTVEERHVEYYSLVR